MHQAASGVVPSASNRLGRADRRLDFPCALLHPAVDLSADHANPHKRRGMQRTVEPSVARCCATIWLKFHAS